MNKYICIGLFFGIANVFAASNFDKDIKNFTIKNTPVVFIEDNRFPSYHVMMYFERGSRNDRNDEKGILAHALNLMSSGTSDWDAVEIAKKFEFYGSNINSSVNTNFSTISISGLMRNAKETLNPWCQMIMKANYPKAQIEKELAIEKNELENLVSMPDILAMRIFPQVVYSNTDLAHPSSGFLSNYATYSTEKLKTELSKLLTESTRKIYVAGPASLKNSLEEYLTECKFLANENLKKDTAKNEVIKKIDIANNSLNLVFVPVKGLNQAQIKLGRLIAKENLKPDSALDAISTEMLGGGFMSKLMKEVRVKRGLTYGIRSKIVRTSDLGMAAIGSSTKNASVTKLIEVVMNVLKDIKEKGISDEEFDLAFNSSVGGTPFQFEVTENLLGNLIYLDHNKLPRSELFQFPELAKNITKNQINVRVSELYQNNGLIIFVLGDPSLKNDLLKMDYFKKNKLNIKFTEAKYQDFI